MELPRHTPDELKRLTDSIREHGILCPIVVDSRTSKTIDGIARESIGKSLGLKRIPRVVISGVDNPAEATRLRIELNSARRMLSRTQLSALIKYHLNTGASDRKVASDIGCDRKTVGKVRLAQDGPPTPARQGKDGKFYPTRKTIIATHSTSATRTAARLLDSTDLPPGPATFREARRADNDKRRRERIANLPPETTTTDQYQIKQGDFRVLAQWVGKDRADLLWADPPWVSQWRSNRKDFARAVASILKPGGILVAQTGVENLLDFGDLYRAAGLTYLWTVVLLRRSAAITTRRIRSQHCPVLLLGKGVSRFAPIGILDDIVEGKGLQKTHHPWESPTSEVIPLIRALAPPTATVADLTLGSGTTPVAVATLNLQDGGKRRFMGGDLSAANVKVAKSRIAELLPVKKRKMVTL